MKNKKTLLAIGGGLLTALGIYLVASLLKKKPQSFGEIVTDTKETLTDLPNVIKQATGNYSDDSFPLKKGSGGKNVEALQKYLNKSGNYNLKVDGKFGEKTESAVLSEQAPFSNFKAMYPDAKKGQVTQEFYNMFIKGKYDLFFVSAV